MYSRNRENGGLVTTMSASSSSATHSLLRKSPSPFSGVMALASLRSRYSTSARSIAPSPFASGTSLISTL